MRTIANVLAPVSLDAEGSGGANAGTAAVVICHGMGQQVKWQSLGQLVDALARAGTLEAAYAPAVRQVHVPGAGGESDGFFLGAPRSFCATAIAARAGSEARPRLRGVLGPPH